MLGQRIVVNVRIPKEIPDEHFEEVMAHLRDELRKVTGGDGPTQESLFGP